LHKAANPYRYQATEEEFANTYVVEAESLYRFKPTIEQLASLTKMLDVKTIIITPYYHLFDFGNDREQAQVIKDCWDILAQLSETHSIFIGIKNDRHHKLLASQHCDSIVEVK